MSQTPEGSRRAVRTSQREVKSCGFCYRRKLKCDKVYPCSRCLARGLGDLCERETVNVNGRITGGGPSRTARRQPTLAEVMEENKSLHRKVSTQEKVIRSLLDQMEGGDGAREASRVTTTRRINQSGGSTSRASSIGLEDRVVGDEGGTEYLANVVGQVYGLSPRETTAGQQQQHLFTQPGSHTLDSLRMLVPVDISSALVNYHCNFLHWIHTVFHIPTFLDQHNQWIGNLRKGARTDVTYDYYALYFAVIACSLHFMDEQLALEMGITQDSIKTLPKFWFDTSLNCLQLAGFMTFPTLPVLQAICVLPTIAHAFEYLASLMHCGIGLARDLNFHLVQAGSASSLWGGNVKSQIKRRIWWCLMIADCLTPGAQHPYHLQYPSAWTSPPANVDDLDLSDDRMVIPRQLNEVTCVSQDFSLAFMSKQSANSRFRVVKDFNDRMDRLFDDCPALQPRENEVYTREYAVTGPFDWHPWSRYLWATAIPVMRIQLWRWHLGRSYNDHRFAEAREVCVAAARAVIRIRSEPIPIMFQKNWHVSSHTVICGMVLASELLHGATDPLVTQQLHDEVQEIVRLLREDSNPNAMVQRGVAILDQMLAEATAAKATIGHLQQYSNDHIPGGFTWPAGDGSGDIQLDLFDMLLNSDAWAMPNLDTIPQ
ncbi:hypothetical protein CI109_104421 [Kwoniella shandongensis]|uniref:Zn(2)-C6 fungal-type domain-containing protein n=1 Tax=Kwoniella shandongensis TaxID=1734106 RepID=A0AAJ8LIK1_9TREE